ncbi:hypothetical protein [Dongshaea marina]|uniref:hypothetical protein n=1 Tax=Dongshaea marina TaxID=2047966 RepID=UPI00131F4003|nr:hypothetical protein [Dongshaea marina]
MRHFFNSIKNSRLHCRRDGLALCYSFSKINHYNRPNIHPESLLMLLYRSEQLSAPPRRNALI